MTRRVPHPNKTKFRWQVGMPGKWVSQHTSLACAQEEARQLKLPVYDRLRETVL